MALLQGECRVVSLEDEVNTARLAATHAEPASAFGILDDGTGA